VLDAFNPIGGATRCSTSSRRPSPTLIVDLVRNRDFADRPIMPDEKQFGPQLPDAQRYWGSVPPYWKAVTDFLTTRPGGDDVRPGAIDISPETLDYLQQTVFGAAGNFVRNVMAIGIEAVVGRPRSVVDQQRDSVRPQGRRRQAGLVRQGRVLFAPGEVEQAVDYGKKYIKSGDREGVLKLIGDERDVLELEKAAKLARKEMRGSRKVRRELDEAVKKGEVSKDDEKRVKSLLDEREAQIINGFDALYLDADEALELILGHLRPPFFPFGVTTSTSPLGLSIRTEPPNMSASPCAMIFMVFAFSITCTQLQVP
jgi:hypothetical protein